MRFSRICEKLSDKDGHETPSEMDDMSTNARSFSILVIALIVLRTACSAYQR